MYIIISKFILGEYKWKMHLKPPYLQMFILSKCCGKCNNICGIDCDMIPSNNNFLTCQSGVFCYLIDACQEMRLR